MIALMTWATIHPYLFTICVFCVASGFPPLVYIPTINKKDTTDAK